MSNLLKIKTEEITMIKEQNNILNEKLGDNEITINELF